MRICGDVSSLRSSAAQRHRLLRARRLRPRSMPVIGFLSGTPSAPFAYLVAAYRQGLREMGYVEGRNLVIEFRWAEGHYDRLPEMAADLVRSLPPAATLPHSRPKQPRQQSQLFSPRVEIR